MGKVLKAFSPLSLRLRLPPLGVPLIWGDGGTAAPSAACKGAGDLGLPEGACLQVS